MDKLAIGTKVRFCNTRLSDYKGLFVGTIGTVVANDGHLFDYVVSSDDKERSQHILVWAREIETVTSTIDHKFDIGDRIVVTSYNVLTITKDWGRVNINGYRGTVVKLPWGLGIGYVHVRLDDNLNGGVSDWGFLENEITPVWEYFSPGTSVVITSYGSVTDPGKIVGQRGMIIQPPQGYEKNKRYFWVQLGNRARPLPCIESDIELYMKKDLPKDPVSENSSPKFKVGDQVVNEVDGQKYTIDSINTEYSYNLRPLATRRVHGVSLKKVSD